MNLYVVVGKDPTRFRSRLGVSRPCDLSMLTYQTFKDDGGAEAVQTEEGTCVILSVALR